MMTRRATPILACAAIALSVAACGSMGSKEQQTSQRSTVSGSAGTSVATTEQKTPAYQQYPSGSAMQSESQRAPADYSPTSRRGASAEQKRSSQQQSMASGAAGHDRQAVRNVQQQLERRGYELGQVDGIYGPRTQRALTAFQRDENLRADGRIGPQTMAALGMGESGQQVGEVPAATGTERRIETERRVETERPVTPAPQVAPEDTGPREQTGQLPGTTGGTDLPQQPGTLPDTGSEAPGSAQPSERSGGIQGNEPSVETPKGGTPETPR